MATAASEPMKLAAGAAGMPAHANDQLNVMASIAPSAAPADTPSVNGVASGLRSSPWNTTPAHASIDPTSAPASVRGSRATKKICASTLSANGMRRIERRAGEIGRSRRAGATRIAPRASTPKHRTVRTRRRRSVTRLCTSGTVRRSGTTVRRPAPAWNVNVRLDAVERADPIGGQHLLCRSRGQHFAVLQQHQRAAQAGGEVEVVGRDRDRHRLAPLQIAQQLGQLQLVGEIERDRRLVQKQQPAAGGPRDLRQRGRDDDALLFPAAERAELAVLERQRAGRRQRVARDREIGRALDLERAEVRIAPHQDDFAHAVVEGEVRLLRHDRHAARERPARRPLETRAVEHTRPRDGRRTPASTRSSVVLPEPFGPRMPTNLFAGTSIDTPRSTGARPG